MIIICFLCRCFFEDKFGMRLKGWLFAESGLWQLLLDCSMKHPWILCSYLMSNCSCGKNKGMTRQKLIHWFRTEGVELVETWASIRAPVVDIVEGCKKVGQIEVTKVTPRKGRVNGS